MIKQYQKVYLIIFSFFIIVISFCNNNSIDINYNNNINTYNEKINLTKINKDIINFDNTNLFKKKTNKNANEVLTKSEKIGIIKKNRNYNRNGDLNNYSNKDYSIHIHNIDLGPSIKNPKKIKKIFSNKLLYDKYWNIKCYIDENNTNAKYNSISSSCSNIHNNKINNIGIMDNDSQFNVNNKNNNNRKLTRNISIPNIMINNNNKIKNIDSYNVNNNSNLPKVIKKQSEVYAPNINKTRIKANSIYNNKNKLNISKKEKAIYILAKSKILTLVERIIFSRGSSNLKNIISISEILNDHEIFMKKKINEYNNKLIKYNNEIKTYIFMASKTSEISLNFIMEKHEKELIDNYNNLMKSNDSNFEYYENFINIIYNIISENDVCQNEVDKKILITNLYAKINEKGFKFIKDYYYNTFITEKNNFVSILKNIDKINMIISKKPKILDVKKSLEMCRFFSFSVYLIQEIVDYGNLMNSIFSLINQTKNAVKVVQYKLDLCKKKNSN